MLPPGPLGNNSLSGCQSNLPLKSPHWIVLGTAYHIELGF